MRRMLSAKSAILAELEFIRRCSFILCRCVILLFAFRAYKSNDYSHLSAIRYLSEFDGFDEFDEFDEFQQTHLNS